MIHLWVDPRYGDDSLASGSGAMNPNGAQTIVLPPCPCQPTGIAPNDILDVNGKLLLNAPYPFRTVRAAVQYINRLAVLAGYAVGTPPLPYRSPTGWLWRHAIIHLLPGIYGANPIDHHEDNGLVANGEVFPIYLPPNVSIQGTSALNTFFDLRGATAFVFGVKVFSTTGEPVGPAHEGGPDPHWYRVDGANSLISTVTFFGGGRHPSQNPIGSEQAAILIENDVASRPTVVNCFFLSNVVGVLVNASFAGDPNATPQVVHDGTAIVHCTFYGNTVGVWNGQNAGEPVVPLVRGWSKLQVVSNVFDATRQGTDLAVPVPCSEFGTGAQWPGLPNTWPGQFAGPGFEGIPAEDMQVETAPGSGVFEDFNAYERVVRDGVPTPYENYDTGVPITGLALSPTQRRPGTTQPIPVASRNLAAITGYIMNFGAPVHRPRGILYVRDLFCNGRKWGSVGQHQVFPDVATGPQGHFDGSPHDLRLCPTAATCTDTQLQAPHLRNPLVDNGYGGGYPALMANGLTLARPGALALSAASQWSWSFDAMAYDAEGFGNPRVHDHPSFPNTAGRPTGWEWTDVGADEVGELIVAGYRFGTTMFVQLDEQDPANRIWRAGVIQPPTPIKNHLQWYIGPVTNGMGSPPPSPLHPSFAREQPRFRAYGFQSMITEWPLAYLGPAEGRTWHSTELTSLPQRSARPWRFDVNGSLGVPQAPACGSSAQWKDITRATAVDIVPHLLPDLHPWWTEQWNTPEKPQWFAGYSPPTWPFWQPCLGSGVYSVFLYDYGSPTGARYPSSGLINPPGTYVGAVPTGTYQWLDEEPGFMSGAPAFVRFNDWEHSVSGAFPITEFDAWCQGRGALGALTRDRHELPVTASANVAGAALALRFSLEWSGTGAFSAQNNTQSFSVLIKEDPQ